jgi:hypothetical protein
MSITLKSRTIVIGVIIALVGLFALGWIIGTIKARKSAKRAENALKLEINRYKVELSGKTLYVAQVEQELGTAREAIRNSQITNKELKALNLKKANEISKLNLMIDTLLTHVEHNGKIISVLIKQVDSLSNITTEVYRPAVLLPFKFQKKDEWLDFSGVLDEKADLSVAVKMKVDVDVITGTDKKGNNSISVVTKNPYINPLSVSSFKTDTKKPTRFGIGVQIGWGACLQNPIKTNPYIGIGLSYNFIRF